MQFCRRELGPRFVIIGCLQTRTAKSKVLREVICAVQRNLLMQATADRMVAIEIAWISGKFWNCCVITVDYSARTYQWFFQNCRYLQTAHESFWYDKWVMGCCPEILQCTSSLLTNLGWIIRFLFTWLVLGSYQQIHFTANMFVSVHLCVNGKV